MENIALISLNKSINLEKFKLSKKGIFLRHITRFPNCETCLILSNLSLLYCSQYIKRTPPPPITLKIIIILAL